MSNRKSTGVTRNVDPLGRFVIPKEIRKKLGITTGTPIEISKFDNEIILRPIAQDCVICGQSEHTYELEENVWICPDCIEKIKNIPIEP